MWMTDSIKNRNTQANHRTSQASSNKIWNMDKFRLRILIIIQMIISNSRTYITKTPKHRSHLMSSRCRINSKVILMINKSIIMIPNNILKMRNLNEAKVCCKLTLFLLLGNHNSLRNSCMMRKMNRGCPNGMGRILLIFWVHIKVTRMKIILRKRISFRIGNTMLKIFSSRSRKQFLKLKYSTY